MKKTLCLLLVIVMTFGIFAAVSAEAKKPKVGISMPTKTLERCSRDGTYLEQHFKEAGYDTILTYADNNIDTQVNDLQNMLADEVSLLIVFAVDGESLNTVMDEAKRLNVPVIAYDRLILNDAVSYYVSFDNYQVGKLQGQFVEKALDLPNAGDKVFNIEFTGGDPADHNALFFFNGAFDVIKPYIDSGKVKVPSGQTEFAKVATDRWDTNIALNRASNVLASYYAGGTKLDAWICSNDAVSLGVQQALESDYRGDNHVVVTGQDGETANLAKIADGKQDMTVYKNVKDEAVVTLALAKAMLSGKVDGEALAKSVGVPCVFNTESYQTSEGHNCPSFLLTPMVITKDNLQALVDTGVYVKGDDGYLKPVQQ